MNLSSVMPASQARANLYQILAEAGDDWRQFIIRSRGRGDVVIMSAEELEGWKETLDIMSNPKLVADIRQGKKEIGQGKGIPYAKAKKLLGWK